MLRPTSVTGTSSSVPDSGMPAQPDIEGDMSPRSPRTPLPKLQLFVVFYVQLAEPIASTVIYPFVNQLVRATGITDGDERRTGYFAGEHKETRDPSLVCSLLYCYFRPHCE
jgi:hypothetical protein